MIFDDIIVVVIFLVGGFSEVVGICVGDKIVVIEDFIVVG